MLDSRPDDVMDSEPTRTFHEEAALAPAPPAGYVTRQYFVKLSPPHVTYVLIGLNLAMFVVTLIWGYSRYGTFNGSENVDVLIDLGAKVNEFIAIGQWWRLFTSMFLHIGVLHLLFNIYALYAIGSLVEAYYGHVRFAVIYLLGGIFGSLGSYAFSPSISAGASGAIFAIVGAAAVYFFRYRENFGARGRAVLNNMILVLVINFAFGLAGSGVDNWGHFGGLVGGVLVSVGLLPKYERPTAYSAGPQAMTVVHRPVAEALWTLLIFALFLLGVWFTGTVHLQAMQ